MKSLTDVHTPFFFGRLRNTFDTAVLFQNCVEGFPIECQLVFPTLSADSKHNIRMQSDKGKARGFNGCNNEVRLWDEGKLSVNEIMGLIRLKR